MGWMLENQKAWLEKSHCWPGASPRAHCLLFSHSGAGDTCAASWGPLTWRQSTWRVLCAGGTAAAGGECPLNCDPVQPGCAGGPLGNKELKSPTFTHAQHLRLSPDGLGWGLQVLGSFLG